VGDAGWTYAHNEGRLAVEKEFGDKVKTSIRREGAREALRPSA
jgi:basic membrane lipoprotein Med (substrate-binding protein (PBP1-ABC) superfamily)